jgi:hypothetical protein
MARISAHARRILARYVIPFCIIFGVVGLAGYLFEAKPCTKPITRDVVRDIDLAQGKSYYLWYNISESAILESQTLHVSFTVGGDGTIDFYVMSDSQYERWENGSKASGIFEEKAKNSDDSFFVPPNYGKYYLVLDNTPYNLSKSVAFRCTWIAVADLVDYSESFIWLVLSVISLVAAAALNMLSGNPIGTSLRKLLEYACPKRAKEIRQTESLKVRINGSLRLFWIFVCLLAVIMMTLSIHNVLINIPFFQSFPELVPMSTDVLIRIFLYYILGLWFLAALFLFWEWVYGFLDDVQVWYLVDRKNLQWNAKLSITSYNIMKRMLLSTTSIACYALAGIFLAAGCLVPEFRFPLLAIGTLVFSIPVSRAEFISFRKACEIQKVKWRTELKRGRPFTINEVVIAILMVPMFLTTLSLLFPMVLNILDAIVVNSFSGPRFQAFFYSELNPRKQFSIALGLITADAVILSSVLFLLIIFATEYLMPQIAKRTTRREKVKLLATPTIAFLMAFMTCEVYTRFVEVAYATRPEWSLVISLVAFAVTYLAGMAYEEAIK